MGFWDRFGRGAAENTSATANNDADEQAIARYRYLLRTAPPETIEQAHAEAFAALTPEQRRKVLQRLSEEMSDAERRAVAAAGDSPGALAQAATRAEIRQPGAIERAFGGMSAAGPSQGANNPEARSAEGRLIPAAAPAGAPGFGSMLAGSMLGSIAGTVLGGMVAQHFFGTHPEASHLFDGSAHDQHADASLSDHDASGDTLDNDGDFAGDFGGDTFDV